MAVDTTFFMKIENPCVRATHRLLKKKYGRLLKITCKSGNDHSLVDISRCIRPGKYNHCLLFKYRTYSRFRDCQCACPSWQKFCKQGAQSPSKTNLKLICPIWKLLDVLMWFIEDINVIFETGYHYLKAKFTSPITAEVALKYEKR